MKPMRITHKLWLTLDEGEEYSYREGGETDEGYDSSSFQYERHRDTIYLEIFRSARDCDGPLSQYIQRTWRIDGSVNEHGYPLFTELKNETYDHSARAANY